MRLRFLTSDVFTDRRFGGNQLAVLPDAAGLETDRMQAIAAEFNYSETTFVLPPRDPAHLAQVRIFTPRAEMPFAGHPTIGTALALHWLGRVAAESAFVLELPAGPVPVELTRDPTAAVFAELTAPAAATHSAPMDPAPVARALGLAPGEIVSGGGLPCTASCGAPFLLAELVSLAALGRAWLNSAAGLPKVAVVGVLVFTRISDTGELRARMFAPAHGIPEDPATGSAAAALAGFLASRSDRGEDWHTWRIAQGIEMGRPSRITVRARRSGGRVAEVRVGGTAVPVAEGTIETAA